MQDECQPEREESELTPNTRLAELWRRIECNPAYAHASVIVPSLSFDPEELAKISGVSFYEERLLFLLMRLRNPASRVLYVTSQPLAPETIDYCLDLLTGVPASHARARLMTLCVHDARPVALTQKILERPRVVARMRAWIGNPRRAYLSCFNSSDLERTLARELRIPLNGVDPDLLELGSKSGSRRIFRQAGVDCPEGYENVRAKSEVVERLLQLEPCEPLMEKAVLKLNESFSGEGNAIFTYPAERRSRAAIEESLTHLNWSSKSESTSPFFAKLAAHGGIVERFVQADMVRSPSIQMRITPTGEIQILSTHEQVLGGETQQAYQGCRFPALDGYRHLLHRDGLKIARVLKEQGVISRFAIDFMAWRTHHDPEWRLLAIEINLRLGSTTFPFLALEFLTNGRLDEEGHFVSARGQRKFYVATDSMTSPHYRGLLPQDLMDMMIEKHLIFDPGPETGVLFHMIGALSQFGKLGLIAIGDSPEGAQKHFDETRNVLDRETGLRRSRLARPAGQLPIATHRID